jgi:hypothetical protein
MLQSAPNKFSRGCAVGLSLSLMILPALGCDQSQQQRAPVIDTGSTGKMPSAGLPPPETHKMELTKPSGPIKKMPGAKRPGGV